MKQTGQQSKAAVGRITMAPADMLERNKAVVRRYVEEIWNKEDLSRAGEVIAGDFRYHQTGPRAEEPREHRGVAGLRRVMEDYRKAFPDHKAEILEMIAEGDRVIAHFRMKGTFKGDLMGIPATGKVVSFNGVGLYRVENGKIAEDDFFDNLPSTLRALGASLCQNPAHPGGK